MIVGWELPAPKPSTSKQRQALHKFKVDKELVKKLNRDQAALLMSAYATIAAELNENDPEQFWGTGAD